MATTYEAALIPTIEGVDADGDGAILRVRWRLVCGQITAEVLQDQVRVARNATDAAVEDALDRRRGEVAAEYLTAFEASPVADLRERFVGRTL